VRAVAVSCFAFCFAPARFYSTLLANSAATLADANLPLLLILDGTAERAAPAVLSVNAPDKKSHTGADTAQVPAATLKNVATDWHTHLFWTTVMKMISCARNVHTLCTLPFKIGCCNNAAEVLFGPLVADFAVDSTPYSQRN